MLLTSNVWRSTSTQSPMRFVPDTDEWLNRRVDNGDSDNAWGEWTMLGGQMHICPALAVDQTAYFAYLDKQLHRAGQRRLRRRFLDRRRQLRAGRAPAQARA